MEYTPWVDVGYLLGYVLLGFAALHPSAHALSEPAPERRERITVARMVWLGTALMLAPVTDQVNHLTGWGRGSWAVLVAGCVAAVLVVVRLGDLIRDLQSNAVQLAALARRDGLTGIANRRSWDHELSRACAHARDAGKPLVVAVLDMDRFKLFNDTYGHVRGDLVLKETAAAWAGILAGDGFLARFGGEEFTVLVPNVTSADAGGAPRPAAQVGAARPDLLDRVRRVGRRRGPRRPGGPGRRRALPRQARRSEPDRLPRRGRRQRGHPVDRRATCRRPAAGRLPADRRPAHR
ncbi:GGDEF domain-containing protein [Nocardioides sp. TF02-7]|uniref:GGDEF domain-containing protein n=1 Tax=Nocardioides sp. TF02-7 TaxID=2917724 RepID=UPI001F067608|nr:GGDEF domain-containing protein [Nocardioides sp. TF02-7]UMG93602.1 GGDEF domain-containing protein [Nocardioides sp. TF02-7]